jgi:hypothetical protein
MNKTITTLLLSGAMQLTVLGSVSIYEKVEEALLPFKPNSVEFTTKYTELLKANPKEKWDVLYASILTFDLSKDRTVELIDIFRMVYPCKREEDTHDAKSPIPEPRKPSKVSNPLDKLYYMPPLRPIVTPPSTTPETKYK